MTTGQTGEKTDVVIFEAEDIERTLKRLSHELIEFNHGLKNVVLLGIVTRGKSLAERVGRLLQQMEGAQLGEEGIPQGYLDITLYRDDTGQTFKPASESHVPVELTGKKVILIDDVLWTGRTIRAALDALLAYGRPEKVELLVLIDRRFSRHLPIEPDYIGHQVDSLNSQQVKVTWASEGSEDKVILISEPPLPK